MSTYQRINQQNTGSGSSTNINCGTNVAGTNLHQTITCPSIPGETPTLIPVVTQRVVEVQVRGGTVSEAQSPCNPDEVVTGGGYDVSEAAITSFGGRPIEEFASNNAWHIKIDKPSRWHW